MRRYLMMLLCLMMLATSAMADESWTEESAWGDTICYTRTDTEWGSILCVGFGESVMWISRLTYGSLTITECDAYVAVDDASTGLETFYRGVPWPEIDTPEEALAAFAEDVVANAEVAFVHDKGRHQLMIPGAGEVEVPSQASVRDAYNRGPRLFMTLDTADERHFLYIVTWEDGLDVRAMEMPWAGSFDTYHISPNAEDNDYFVLYLDAAEDFGYIVVEEHESRWQISCINTGWEVLGVQAWGVWDDLNMYPAYGTHPWHDIETMDWNTLPMSYGEAVSVLQNEGWRFAVQDAPLYAEPDASSPVTVTCPQDTPVHVIRTEGDWAWVGLQMTDDDLVPYVGYMLLSETNALPETVLPGGEVLGWFCTMTVEENVLTFAPVDDYYEFPSLEVAEGFADAVRAVYAQTGYAATPVRFDDALLPYLKGYVYPRQTVCDAFLTDEALLLSVYDPDKNACLLQILAELPEGERETSLLMPGAFRFDRRNVDRWKIGITFVE